MFLIFLALVALPERVPALVTPYGEPKSELQVRAFLDEYCSPINAWESAAFSLCIESGLKINQAVSLSNQYSCPQSDAPQCQQALHLYQQNFRLWQGSVDNIQRAKAYSLALKKKGPEPILKQKHKQQVEFNTFIAPPVLDEPSRNDIAISRENTALVENKIIKQEVVVGEAGQQKTQSSKLAVSKQVVMNGRTFKALELNEAELEEQCLAQLTKWLIPNEILLNEYEIKLQQLQQSMQSANSVQISLHRGALRYIQASPVSESNVHCQEVTSYGLKKQKFLSRWSNAESQKLALFKRLDEDFVFESNLTEYVFYAVIFLFLFALLGAFYRRKA